MLQINRFHPWLPITIIFIISVFSSCQSKETSEDLPNASIETSNAKNPSQPPGKTSLAYTPPAGWLQQEPSSSMRHDQYELPGSEGSDPATLAIFKGIGGSVNSNIDRWKKQFITPPSTAESNWAKQESKVINQIPVHIVSVQGTYLKSRMPMMMDGPKIELKDYALLAVIAETNTGLWFFKATGPQKTVKFWEKDFDAFINTFRLN